MVTCVYTYDVVPGKAVEAREWARKNWIPFWREQAAVRSYRVLANFFGAEKGVPVGSPQRAVIIDVESASALEQILAQSKCRELMEQLQAYAVNVQVVYYRTTFSFQRSPITDGRG